ncbi:uncharacterized protein LOC135809280 [Sycon ciliatum]|uniref:uncharacterized protein LOC135809280 n=1 Tax=Sycon ciliatum TaxID=27933 RepID=UPI0031F63FEA
MADPLSLSADHSEKSDGGSDKVEIIEKKAGFVWSTLLTLDLIQSRSKRDPLFSDINYKKKSIWQQIASDIEENNPELDQSYPTAEQCENRWKSLLRGYKAFVDSQNQTGADRKKEPAFYSEMNAVLGEKPNVRPQCVAGSLPAAAQPIKRAANAAIDDGDAAQDDGGEQEAVTTAVPTKKRRRSSTNKPQQSEAFQWLKAERAEEKATAAKQHTDQISVLNRLASAVEKFSSI